VFLDLCLLVEISLYGKAQGALEYMLTMTKEALTARANEILRDRRIDFSVAAVLTQLAESLAESGQLEYAEQIRTLAKSSQRAGDLQEDAGTSLLRVLSLGLEPELVAILRQFMPIWRIMEEGIEGVFGRRKALFAKAYAIAIAEAKIASARSLSQEDPLDTANLELLYLELTGMDSTPAWASLIAAIAAAVHLAILNKASLQEALLRATLAAENRKSEERLEQRLAKRAETERIREENRQLFEEVVALLPGDSTDLDALVVAVQNAYERLPAQLIKDYQREVMKLDLSREAVDRLNSLKEP